MTDPTNIFAMDEIKFITGLHVEPVVASETAIRDAVAKYFAKSSNGSSSSTGGGGGGAARAPTWCRRRSRTSAAATTASSRSSRTPRRSTPRRSRRQSGEAPIIRLVNALMLSAIQKGASDIHIEPYEKEMRIRFRIDGVLQAVMAPALKYRDPIISRIKIMARLDIAEKRLPQDGRIKARFNDNNKLREIDFRVSCLPTLFGEKVVMRLLDSGKLQLDMTKLGFDGRRARGGSSTPSRSRGAWCSSRARPAAARRTRSTRRCRSSTRPA